MTEILAVLRFALACTFLYYALFRAELTRFFWSRVDELRFFGAMGRCPACAGFWIGLGLAFFLAPGIETASPGSALRWGAVLGTVLTPLLFWPFHEALLRTAIGLPIGFSPAAKGGTCGAAHPANPTLICTVSGPHDMHEAAFNGINHSWETHSDDVDAEA